MNMEKYVSTGYVVEVFIVLPDATSIEDAASTVESMLNGVEFYIESVEDTTWPKEDSDGPE
jgi:hypothetical protein